ncbi:hypothetical protein PAECIP111802_06921 [Paenibacillus allorhizosphaerae]|uniref:Uncharacterized protein n=1 Tax=Paenibacillus allorhizosphaerae TaxID=2849866 RepID=A0ABN7TWU2_9BACL|nr:hypothetical protein PAECIP111802_06921 [Paenibacillus allorhizosphaerae]
MMHDLEESNFLFGLYNGICLSLMIWVMIYMFFF